jgi:class 3 adenylate cyclase
VAPAGAWRLRTLEAGPELDLESGDEGFPEVIATDDAMRTGSPQPPGRVALRNDTTRPRTLVIEERAWVRDALTADRVTALQSFRDLFSDQVLRPGDEVAVRHVALMFTDLKASTALYGRIGDAAAYGLVREHFAFLTAIVRRHDGAIVKTIGDAVMAAFTDSRRAFDAAVAIQREIGAASWGREGEGIVIKVGLHAGPCIAVNLNGRMDYFGSTVNLAARLQGESTGGDIVVSTAVAAEAAIDTGADGVLCTNERARLRGFTDPVGFLRVRVAAAADGMD